MYDFVVIGAGSGGLTAAAFAAKLGVKVALVEKHRVGGDCTWTGCVPSKALVKVAKVAHEVRTAARFGVVTTVTAVDMLLVRDYVAGAVKRVYEQETPEELEKLGIEVVLGAARFLDSRTIQVGERTIQSKAFLIATGARPFVPKVAGLGEVPFLTYERIFDNDRLPGTMVVLGGGPIGLEIAQAYQRLGSQVTVVAEELLPKDEPEARAMIERVFAKEGVRVVHGLAQAASRQGDEVLVTVAGNVVRGEMLFVAAGRRPVVEGLTLEKAGVDYSFEKGIWVNDQLRTSAAGIYAAGDVTGGYQFTHFAGWQAFQAARNALLPGSSSGFSDVVPWVTFTDPEVAHIGLSEAQARLTDSTVQMRRWPVDRTDRAVCEGEEEGFVKVITKKDGTLLGATVVSGRAGETIAELTLAIKNQLKIADLAATIHPYPTYSSALQQLAAEAAVEGYLSGTSGKIIRGLSQLIG